VPHRALLWGAVLVAGIGFLSVAAVAGPEQQRGGTLRVSGTHDLNLDPATAYSVEAWGVEYATCAKLYDYPDKPAPEGSRVISEVATGRPRISKDGKTQTIALRKTYRFHTGARVTAANFVAAFNRDANPNTQSPAVDAGYLDEIVGARAVIAGTAQTVSGVRALGPYVLQIRTTKPLYDLPERLTMPFFCPVAVDTPSGPIDAPLGSGPYYVAAHVPNRQITLERNKYYRGPRPANVDRIVWTVGDPKACVQAVERDDLDWCVFVSGGDLSELAAKYVVNAPNGRLYADSTLATYFFAFNHDRPAFRGAGQIPLKQAINWAIDRPALVRAAGYLSSKRTDQILPDAMARKAKIYPLEGVNARSLAKANALYARASFRPERLTLYTCTTCSAGVSAIWAQIFAFDLKRLGIDVDVKAFSNSELLRRIGTRGEPFDVVIDAWNPDWPDASTYFGPLLDGRKIRKDGNLNHAYFNRPEYNRQIDRIERLTGTARSKAWADLDVEMMRDDPPWAPFEEITNKSFISKSYGCFVYQPAIGMIDLVAACKK
jgi:peptide/nickel transport system substrate-binding protein